MPDKVTYDSEINQSAHRPGMESVVNRGAPPTTPSARADARDQSGNRTSEARPTVAAGHIDPFSVKGDAAPATPAKTPMAAPDDGSGAGGRQREAAIMNEVQKAGG